MLNLSSDEMEALVEHREKLDAELEQLRENRMELEVVKNLPDSLEVVSRVSLKKVGGKPKTRTISKSL